jgi:NAD(P)-dependent dehydrogenase (short-subunit alcohol dehydrogenase family)
MSEMHDKQRSAVVFGARNLGRAVIELLVSDGWAVAGVARSRRAFGGGPIAESDLDGFDSWMAAPARAAFSFLSAGGRFAIAQSRAATLVQVTGGSARRAMPDRGLWAAGSFAVRAITNAAALELRPHGIQVTLLIVDAGIQPLDGSTRAGVSPQSLADPRRIADAALFLANQDARAATHELQLTPLAENWTP